MYKSFLRPLLFRMNAESAHNLVLSTLRMFKKFPIIRAFVRLLFKYESPKLHRNVFGINFPNPVGLSAGMDKNGKCYNEFADFGFGFVEIGSLTPKPQSGNPCPRIFRLPKDRAIINRMGMNNEGILSAISNLKNDHPEVIIAASISKNTTSQEEQITRDYEYAFSMLYDFVDMFVVNVSCPNVAGVTALQEPSFISDIIDPILNRRTCMDKYKPVLIKVSLDLEYDSLDDMLSYAMRSGVDGIVIGNTSNSRTGLETPQNELDKIGKGGLSGAPLYKKSLEMVKYVYNKTCGRLPIIGVGGIMSEKQAYEMLNSGASLIEIYSGFIYEGPSFVKRILKYLSKKNK